METVKTTPPLDRLGVFLLTSYPASKFVCHSKPHLGIRNCLIVPCELDQAVYQPQLRYTCGLRRRTLQPGSFRTFAVRALRVNEIAIIMTFTGLTKSAVSKLQCVDMTTPSGKVKTISASPKTDWEFVVKLFHESGTPELNLWKELLKVVKPKVSPVANPAHISPTPHSTLPSFEFTGALFGAEPPVELGLDDLASTSLASYDDRKLSAPQPSRRSISWSNPRAILLLGVFLVVLAYTSNEVNASPVSIGDTVRDAPFFELYESQLSALSPFEYTLFTVHDRISDGISQENSNSSESDLTWCPTSVPGNHLRSARAHHGDGTRLSLASIIPSEQPYIFDNYAGFHSLDVEDRIPANQIYGTSMYSHFDPSIRFEAGLYLVYNPSQRGTPSGLVETGSTNQTIVDGLSHGIPEMIVGEDVTRDLDDRMIDTDDLTSVVLEIESPRALPYQSEERRDANRSGYGTKIPDSYGITSFRGSLDESHRLVCLLIFAWFVMLWMYPEDPNSDINALILSELLKCTIQQRINEVESARSCRQVVAPTIPESYLMIENLKGTVSKLQDGLSHLRGELKMLFLAHTTHEESVLDLHERLHRVIKSDLHGAITSTRMDERSIKNGRRMRYSKGIRNRLPSISEDGRDNTSARTSNKVIK